VLAAAEKPAAPQAIKELPSKIKRGEMTTAATRKIVKAQDTAITPELPTKTRRKPSSDWDRGFSDGYCGGVTIGTLLTHLMDTNEVPEFCRGIVKGMRDRNTSVEQLPAITFLLEKIEQVTPEVTARPAEGRGPKCCQLMPHSPPQMFFPRRQK